MLTITGIPPLRMGTPLNSPLKKGDKGGCFSSIAKPTIYDTVEEFSTTCCQLVKVASILNQCWTSWQHVVPKPVQIESANSIVI